MPKVKRRFPGADSPISDIESIRIGDSPAREAPPADLAYLPSAVTPQTGVETPAPEAPRVPAAPVVEPALVTDAPAEVAPPAAPAQEVPTAPVVAGPDLSVKKPTTIPMRLELKKRAETAVKITKEIPGHYKSWTALVEGAVEHELERLSGELNGGVPFEVNTGAPLTTGRPANDKT